MTKIKKKKPYVKKNAGNVPANNAFFNAGMGMAESLNESVSMKDAFFSLISEEYVSTIEKIVTRYSNYIKTQNYSELYSELALDSSISGYDTGLFTEFLMVSGIDPLKYMTKIPPDYLKGTMLVTELKIPDHITDIQSFSFEKSNIKTLYMPKSVKFISTFAFRDLLHNLTIEFDGTKDDWDIILIANQHAEKYVTVNCNETKEVLEYTNL